MIFTSNRGRRLISALLVLSLTLAMTLTLDMGDVYAAYSDPASPSDNQEQVTTTISGYQTVINKRYNQKVKVKAVISSDEGNRKVKLQRFSTSKNKWSTIKTVSTGSADVSTVSFSIPKKYRKKTTSLWRLYVPAKGDASSAVSENITLTTRNIKTYKMSARAACVYRIDGDGIGTLIYTKNSDKKLAQASTTKLMTAALLIESGKLGGTTTISSHAAKTPWGSGRLSKGDIYNNSDLLYAMLLPSSNDAATAVAETVGGSEAGFVAMMNAKAAQLGLVNTHFMNPHGLDASGHYTTAVELAKLTAYAYTFPEIRTCWATKSKKIKSLKNKKSWTLWSTNAIFSYVKEFLGGKTGTEDNARCCFAGAYTYGGQTYVTVVLGSGYGFSRWADTKKLHKYIRKYAAGRY